MKKLIVPCRKGDVRRIKISCRCGKIFIAEIPQQIARALSLHPCPGCGAGFGVTQQPDKKWKVERIADSVSDMAFVVPSDGSGPESEKGYAVGIRIRIVDVTKHNATRNMQYNNPHPEHIGKLGTIIGEEDCGEGLSTPRIRLDDGTVLTGAECWWEPITQ